MDKLAASAAVAFGILVDRTGLTRQAVAEKTGLPPYKISRIASGQIRLMFHDAAIFCKAFGLNIDDLAELSQKIMREHPKILELADAHGKMKRRLITERKQLAESLKNLK